MEKKWRVRCPNCGAKTEFYDLSYAAALPAASPQDQPWWVGTGCTMWINRDLQCGHPLTAEDIIKARGSDELPGT